MKRREAIRNLLLVVGGVVVLPSCLHQRSGASIALRHLQIGAAEEKLLAELVGTLIPTTDTPGAKDTYTHLFVLRMVDDCFDKEVQGKFIKGLKGVDGLARERFRSSFAESTPDQRESVLAALEKKAAANAEEDDSTTFYTTVKKLAIQGYLNSKYVLTEVHKYELVPGRYNGAFPVKQTHQNL